MIFVKLIAWTWLLAALGYVWFEATNIPIGGFVATFIWLGVVVLIIRRHEAKHDGMTVENDLRWHG